jgi:CBS domain-containing protein
MIVPIPTAPPSTQPTISTRTSKAVRVRETLQPFLLLKPGMRPSRGPAPKRASAETRVAELMDYKFAALKAADDQEMAVSAFRREDLTALPVTDSSGTLIGIVTVDDVLDVAAAEATEDIQKIGGVEVLDQPFMEIALSRMIRKRASWLIILFLGEMLTTTAMGFFEAQIAQAVVLALFVPPSSRRVETQAPKRPLL